MIADRADRGRRVRRVRGDGETPAAGERAGAGACRIIHDVEQPVAVGRGAGEGREVGSVGTNGRGRRERVMAEVRRLVGARQDGVRAGRQLIERGVVHGHRHVGRRAAADVREENSPVGAGAGGADQHHLQVVRHRMSEPLQRQRDLRDVAEQTGDDVRRGINRRHVGERKRDGIGVVVNSRGRAGRRHGEIEVGAGVVHAVAHGHSDGRRARHTIRRLDDERLNHVVEKDDVRVRNEIGVRRTAGQEQAAHRRLGIADGDVERPRRAAHERDPVGDRRNRRRGVARRVNRQIT